MDKSNRQAIVGVSPFFKHIVTHWSRVQAGDKLQLHRKMGFCIFRIVLSSPGLPPVWLGPPIVNKSGQSVVSSIISVPSPDVSEYTGVETCRGLRLLLQMVRVTKLKLYVN
jgi:hypothetical protein